MTSFDATNFSFEFGIYICPLTKKEQITSEVVAVMYGTGPNDYLYQDDIILELGNIHQLGINYFHRCQFN